MGPSFFILVSGMNNFEVSPPCLEKCDNGIIHKGRWADEGYKKPVVSVRFVHSQGSYHLGCRLKPLIQGPAQSLTLYLSWWIITIILF